MSSNATIIHTIQSSQNSVCRECGVHVLANVVTLLWQLLPALPLQVVVMNTRSWWTKDTYLFLFYTNRSKTMYLKLNVLTHGRMFTPNSVRALLDWRVEELDLLPQSLGLLVQLGSLLLHFADVLHSLLQRGGFADLCRRAWDPFTQTHHHH